MVQSTMNQVLPRANIRLIVLYHAGGNCRIHDLLEGLEYPEYVMHIFYLKYSGTPNMGIC